MKQSSHSGHSTKLAATKLPDGFRLMEEVGVSRDPNTLYNRAVQMTGRSDLCARKGAEVGLVYETDGKRTPAPEYYHCIIAPVTDLKNLLEPSPTKLFEVAWTNQQDLLSGVNSFLGSNPSEGDVSRMLGFVQGICVCRSWTVPVEVYAMTVGYQQRARLGKVSTPS